MQDPKTLRFTKMNGAGNDFVMIDNREGGFLPTQEMLAKLCNRHRGVGADGVLLAECTDRDHVVTERQLDKELADTFPASDTPQSIRETGQSADYRMRYYNADGGEVEMCGNGARCFARFVQKLEAADGKPVRRAVSFDTIAGIITAAYEGELVRLRMSTPYSLTLDNQLEVQGATLQVHSVNTGVPHAVVFTDDLGDYPVNEHGAALRYHQHFAPAGTNANFVQVTSPQELRIRTYERGVEDETLACGTGVVAAALIHATQTGAQSPIAVQVKGGETMQVAFELEGQGAQSVFTNVDLIGPADFVFEGTLPI